MLKSLAATLLMGLLLFNWLGFHLFYTVLQESSDRRLEARFDSNNYEESELLIIKIPLNLPYLTDQPDFQRVDGEITLNGIHYKYIKRKIVQDSLVLACLPNHKKMQLTAAKSNYFETVADIGQNESGKAKQNLSHLKYLFTDLDLSDQSCTSSKSTKLPCAEFPVIDLDPYSFRSAALPGQPPESLSGSLI